MSRDRIEKYLIVIVFLTALAGLGLAGCGKPVTLISPYQQGARLLLRYELDVISSGSRGTNREFVTTEFPIVARQSHTKKQTDLRITMRRETSGIKSASRGVKGIDCTVRDSAQQPTKDDGMAEYFPAWLDSIKRFELKVTLDRAAKIVHHSYSGIMGPFDDRSQEAKSGEEETRSGKLMRKIWPGKFLTILDNTTAYLPPEPVALWASWRVKRKLIFPGYLYVFVMACGTAAVSEDAVCWLDAVRSFPGGPIAVIRFRGERHSVPEFQNSRVPRFSAMPSSGEIHVLIDSGHIVFARIETKIVFKPEVDIGEDVTFVEKFTITPDTAGNKAGE